MYTRTKSLLFCISEYIGKVIGDSRDWYVTLRTETCLHHTYSLLIAESRVVQIQIIIVVLAVQLYALQNHLLKFRFEKHKEPICFQDTGYLLGIPINQEVFLEQLNYTFLFIGHDRAGLQQVILLNYRLRENLPEASLELNHLVDRLQQLLFYGVQVANL